MKVHTFFRAHLFAIHPLIYLFIFAWTLSYVRLYGWDSVHWHENDGDTDDINGDGTNAVVLEVKEICPCCQHSSASLFHATKNSTRLRCQTIYVS